MVCDMLCSPETNGFSHSTSLPRRMRETPWMSARQVADQQFRPEARRTQLGMGEIEIVLPLGDVIGELVAEREADAHRRASGSIT